MSQPTCSSPLRLAAGAALLIVAGLAQAQYAWIDAKGVRQYSDRPPPPSTPPAKILKSPQPVALAVDAALPAASADASAQPKKGPPTLAERDAAFRKRQQEGAEQEKKAAEEAQRQQAQRENCASARQYQAQLESGIRIVDTGADGERSFISDAERAARLAKARRIVAGCR